GPCGSVAGPGTPARAARPVGGGGGGLRRRRERRFHQHGGAHARRAAVCLPARRQRGGDRTLPGPARARSRAPPRALPDRGGTPRSRTPRRGEGGMEPLHAAGGGDRRSVLDRRGTRRAARGALRMLRQGVTTLSTVIAISGLHSTSPAVAVV